jgi:hypothetical protein
MLEQGLAVLTAFLVMDVERIMISIQPRAVSEQQGLDKRQKECDHETSRVAPDLDKLFAADGDRAPSVHRPASRSTRPPVSATSI